MILISLLCVICFVRQMGHSTIAMTHSFQELPPRPTPGMKVRPMNNTCALKGCRLTPIVHLSTPRSKTQRSAARPWLTDRKNALDTGRTDGILPTVRSNPVRALPLLDCRGSGRQAPPAVEAQLQRWKQQSWRLQRSRPQYAMLQCSTRAVTDFDWIVPYSS